MIVCMASGNGSNFEAIVDYGIKVDLVITNNPTARVIDRAKKFNIPFIVSKNEYDISYNVNGTIVTMRVNKAVGNNTWVGKNQKFRIRYQMIN